MPLPSPYTTGRAYALGSVATSFSQMDGWLDSSPSAVNPRAWVCPYFNATREASYSVQEQLDVKIAGDQKISPFPHWTLSTETDGKRYTFLSEPVSDFFVNGYVAQSLEGWHEGKHTLATLHAGVDAYYNLGALINFYSHTLSDPTLPTTDLGDAAALTSEYILYCADASKHPNLWAANAAGVYAWWLKRSAAQISASYSTSGDTRTASFDIAGAQDPDTTVELLLPATGRATALKVLPDGTQFRQIGSLVKAKVGTSLHHVQISYTLNPAGLDDTFVLPANAPSVSGPGVLANDSTPSGNAPTAALNSAPPELQLTLNQNGGFSCTETPGTYAFTYKACDGLSRSTPTAAYVTVVPRESYIAENFIDPAAFQAGWNVHSGTWTVSGGALRAYSGRRDYGIAYSYPAGANWTDYAVEAMIKFEPGAYGGGIAGRVGASGTRYAAWIYPEGSGGLPDPAGPPVLRLMRFDAPPLGGVPWETWSTLGQPVPLPGISMGWHVLKLTLQGSRITAYCDQTTVTSYNDATYASGGAGLEMWTADSISGYAMSVDYVKVTTLAAKLQLLMPGETPAPGWPSGKFGTPDPQVAGVPFSVTVNAVDDDWNIVPQVADIVHLASSDSSATLPPDAPLVAGTRTFTLTLNAAGAWTATAADATDPTKLPNTGAPATVPLGGSV